QLCTDFHRVNPETSKNCRISDTELAGKLPEGEKFHCYKCLNGLVDVAAPIVINGLHVANLFSGQFLFEEADRQFFKKQTGKYGFDEKKYLEALEKIPVVSEENVKTAMDFLLNITQMISDITERKLADEKFKMSFMFNPVPQAILSLEGVFIESNQAFAKLIGFSNEEIIGNTAIDMGIFSHEEQDKLASNANASGESIKNALAKFKIRDGSLRDILYSAEPIILNGVPHTLAMGIDVTEQKLAEEQIRFQANLLEAVEQAVIVTNQDGIINYWNPFAEKLYGWFANEVIGRNIVDVNVPQLSQDQASGIMTQLRAGKSWAGEFQVQKRDGTVFTAFVANTPIVNAAGELTAIIGISTDITERKKIENSLRGVL
ncbi:MAG: PAS domain S-box protein, partial [Bacteroidales bacterium]|nr:PAS domain S-box protein [Bacteroidales bacterium]